MSESLPLSIAELPVGQTAVLIDLLFPPPRNFDVRLSDGTLLPAAGSASFGLALKHPGSLR